MSFAVFTVISILRGKKFKTNFCSKSNAKKVQQPSKFENWRLLRVFAIRIESDLVKFLKVLKLRGNTKSVKTNSKRATNETAEGDYPQFFSSDNAFFEQVWLPLPARSAILFSRQVHVELLILFIFRCICLVFYQIHHRFLKMIRLHLQAGPGEYDMH